ncbi:hypothetical protein [Paenibacillus sp. YPG26]|uniref:TadE/TadG family type IV pilus assembly protein n=1 Tax=Paenibacillus sp. YPG26 TaxID=2878915 RepID=UPI00203B802D|nr:hypothetical protein [Paenibacillus sp. YPG26]USB34111.1 hypothetical protein LDO05_04665 [Paenibacillus sp. YPG26]
MFHKERSERGAVTIFLIIIFAFVFAFVSIFIDYARMSALQTQSEQISHAAVRSVLSAYDPDLLERYGLFAYGGTDENYIMSKMLQDEFDLLSRSDDLSIMKAKLDSSSVQLERPLGSHTVFTQQIREQMKYKAPIDFTIEVVNKFKPMSSVMKEASNTVEVMGKLQKLYDEREEKLNQLIDNQRKSAAAVKELSSWISNRGIITIPDEPLNGSISSVRDAAAQFEDYKSKIEEDSKRKPIDRMYDIQISYYANGVSQAFNHVTRGQRDSAAKHQELLPAAKELAEQARLINDQMKQVIKDSENRSANSGYDQVGSGSPGGDEAGSEEIRKIREQSRKLLLPENLLTQMETNIEEQKVSFNRLNGQLSGLISLEGSLHSIAGSSGPIKNAVVSTGQEADNYLRKFVDAGGALDQESKQLATYRSYDDARKKTEQEAKGKLEQAGNILKQLSGLKDKMNAKQEEFNTLEGYFNENVNLNAKGGSSSAGQTSSGSDPYATGQHSMNNMDSLYGSMSSLLDGMTDNCYQTEYAAGYFEHFDVTKLKDIVKGGGSGSINGLVDQFGPEQQEIEYILYGFHNPGGNIAAAYGEIFASRLAVRTMEGFIKNSSAGNPLLILALALLYGIEHAIQDMVTLSEKGSIPLSDYFRVELTYLDYLRIFMLLHGQSDARLSRMLAVIRLNTGINPDQRNTYISSEVTLAMPLWFLPGVAKALNASGILEGRVEGNRYYAVKKADYSY